MRRFLLALLIASLATAHAADRPNILLIVSEDNGPELGCYGEPVVRTPVLDQLAEGGVLFERADVPQAGCRLLGICFWGGALGGAVEGIGEG